LKQGKSNGAKRDTGQLDNWTTGTRS